VLSNMVVVEMSAQSLDCRRGSGQSLGCRSGKWSVT
jgi:hypothetical protein